MDDEVGSAKLTMGFTSKLKRGVLGAFYLVKKNMRVGRRFFYVSTTVMTIQLMHLPLCPRGGFAWNPATQTEVGEVLELFNYGFRTYENEWLFYFVAALSVASTFVMVAGMTCLGYEEVNKQSKYQIIVPALEGLLRLHQTVLLIPSIGVFFKLATCPTSSLSVCDTPGRISTQIIGITTFLVYITVVSLNALLVVKFTPFNDEGKKVDGTFAAPHGRVEFASTIIRAFLAFMLGLLPTTESLTSSIQVAWMIALLISSFALVVLYLYFLPFLNMAWNRFSVAMYGIFFWGCICLVVTQSVNDPEDLSSRVLFVAALPIVMFALVALVDLRIRKLKSASTELVFLNPYLIELRLRLLHFETLDVKRGFVFTGELEEGYKEAMEAFPNSSFLRLYVAEMCSSSKRIVFALNLIREARDAKVSFDNEFFLFCLNKQNMERHHEDDGAASFMTFDTHMSVAREKIASTLKQTAAFWKLLSRGRFTVNQLIAHGAKIHSETQICRHHITKLLNISRSNPEALRLYATYVQYVLNDQQQANKIMERQGQNVDDHSGGYAVATVSGNTNSLGKVMDVTQAMANMFGYSKKDMVGRNVNFLCPSPFDRVHDMLLKQFLSIDADFETKTRSIYGVHSEGYLLPVDFVITPSTNANSDLILIGKFSLRSDPTKHIIMVDYNSNVVTSCTLDAPTVLGVDLNEIFAMNVHLSDILPDFFDDENGNSKYYKYTDKPVFINNFELQIEAKKLIYDSKEKSPVKFKCGVIVITLRVVNRVLDGGSGDDCSDVGIGDVGSDQELADDMAESKPESKPLLNMAVLQQDDSRSVASKKSKLKGTSVSRSVTGKSSGSVGSSITDSNELTIGKIHKLINARLLKKDPRVARFSRFVKYFTFMFITLATVQVVLMLRLYDDFLHTVRYNSLAYGRTHLMATICIILEFSRSQLLHASDQVFHRILPDTATTLTDALNKLRETHFTLVDGTALYGDPVADSLMYDPVMHETTIGHSEQVVFSNVSFHMGYLNFFGHVENYINTDNEVCLDSCKYALNNGFFELFDKSLLHNLHYEELAIEITKFIYQAAGYSVVGIVVFLMVTFVYGFTPMFRMTEHRKETLGKAFISIPRSTMKTLHKRAEKRIVIVQNASVAKNGVDDETDDDEEMYEGDGAEEQLLGPTLTTDSAGSKPEKRVKIGFCSRWCSRKKSEVKISPEATGTHISKKSEIKNESRLTKSVNFTKSLLRVGILFWVVMVFGVAMALYDMIQSTSIRDIQNSVNVAGMRSSYADGAYFWANDYPNNTEVLREEFKNRLEFVFKYQNNFVLFDKALRFGNESLMVSGFKATQGQQYSLYFSDICDASCLAVLNDPRNEELGVPVDMADDMKHGLVLTIDRFIHRINEVSSFGMKDYQVNTTESKDSLYEAMATFGNLPLFLAFGDKLEQSSTYYSDDVTKLVARTRSTKILVICFFIVSMFGGYWATLRMFRQMDKELKDSQTLLFMLPLEVFEEVPEMNNLVFNTNKD